MIERQSARTKGRVHLPLDQGQDGGDRPARIERCQQGTWPGHFLRHDHQAPERRARHVVQKTPKHNRRNTGIPTSGRLVLAVSSTAFATAVMGSLSTPLVRPSSAAVSARGAGGASRRSANCPSRLTGELEGAENAGGSWPEIGVGCYPCVTQMHKGVRPQRPNPLFFRHKACRRIGRGERIRTSGPRLPKTVLYQAELLPGARGYSRLPVPWQ